MSPLFDFELTPVASIAPWGPPEAPRLDWFALTHGRFRIAACGRTLLDDTYQVAAFARDLLATVRAAIAPLPPFVEQLARDWSALAALDAAAPDDYDAWRWLGERSPWFSYLASPPRLSFVRIGDAIRVADDCSLPLETFVAECRSLRDRLLAAMEPRLTSDTLRAQHAEWQREFDAYFAGEYEPDVPWSVAEAALRAISAS